MNHADIVQRIKDEGGHDFGTPEGILAFLLKVIGALPREERGGLLRKDAGENIAWYAPRNCNVSISRVCYPDGKIWKVLTDSGVGGTNGPAWNDDGFVEISRYLEIVSTVPIPEPAPVPPTPCRFDVSAVSARLDQIHAAIIALGQQVDRMDNELEQRDNDLFAAFGTLGTALDELGKKTQTFPAYTGKVPLLGTVTLTPKG